MFLIFRSFLQDNIRNLKLDTHTVSGFASEVWKKCTTEVKDEYRKLSKIAKEKHGYINPGYVYESKRKICQTKSNLTTILSSNSFMQQELRPQTNSFTTFQNFPTFHTMYTCNNIDLSIDYTHIYYPHIYYHHSQHQNICISYSNDQYNTLRNFQGSYDHDNVMSKETIFTGKTSDSEQKLFEFNY
ncbi:hypothetical protein RclHR1_18230001 [Rhizophagus clarus]|nr:hypothetical protein RclHR1_18230001 [Rhizophagus clarus]